MGPVQRVSASQIAIFVPVMRCVSVTRRELHLILAGPRLRLRWFAENLFLLGTALHSDLLINHVAQVWYMEMIHAFHAIFLSVI